MEAVSKNEHFQLILNRYFQYAKDLEESQNFEISTNLFLKMELHYIQILENIMKNLDLLEESDWKVILVDQSKKIYESTEQEMFTQLSNAGLKCSEMINCFLRQDRIFEGSYKVFLNTVCCLEESVSDTHLKDNLTVWKRIILERLHRYADFIKLIRGNADEAIIPFVDSALKTIDDIIVYTGKRNHELSQIISQLVYEKNDFLTKCRNFVVYIVPSIVSDIKFKNKVHFLCGRMECIYREEQNLYVALHRSSECPPNELALLLTESDLCNLYVEDAKLKINCHVIEAFCVSHKQNREMFNQIPKHLFQVIYILTALKNYCVKRFVDYRHVEKAIEKFNKTLKLLDNWTAARYIVGFNEDLSKLGDLILKQEFKVRLHKKEPFKSVVFLFDRAIIFTKEGNILKQLRGYNYKHHIPVDKLGFCEKEKEFEVYTQEKHHRTDFCTVSEKNSEIMQEWISTITKVLENHVASYKLQQKNKVLATVHNKRVTQ